MVLKSCLKKRGTYSTMENTICVTSHIHKFVELQLMIISLCFVYKYQEVKNEKKFQELHLRTCFFRANDCTKPEDIQLAFIYDKEKQQITSDNLEPADVWHFCLKYDRNNESIIKVIFHCSTNLTNCFSSMSLLSASSLLVFSTHSAKSIMSP